MLELEKISESEYNAAIAEEIVIKRGGGKGSSAHSYFVDAVIEDVIADLKDKKNMSETTAANLIYGGGLRIYTTQDSSIQAAIFSLLFVFSSSDNITTNSSPPVR
jgi:penicillin-binding protein 1A